ncbi:MAG: HEPN domain-containing protein, partial [Actinobacteria bacterium]|nr:HEPN domain-containing protein [Actinomycetota bacterium]
AGAYQLGYDSARKALTALLALDGLRLKGEGAHANLIALIQEKYVAVAGVQAVAKLDRLRRTRNEAEYRGYWFDREDVISDLQVVSQVLSFVETASPTA